MTPRPASSTETMCSPGRPESLPIVNEEEEEEDFRSDKAQALHAGASLQNNSESNEHDSSEHSGAATHAESLLIEIDEESAPSSPSGHESMNSSEEPRIDSQSNQENLRTAVESSSICDAHENNSLENRISSESRPQSRLLLQQQHELQNIFDREDWDSLMLLLEDYPELCRFTVNIQCHGERTPVLPLHAAVARKYPCMDVLERLVTMYPEALSIGDTRGNRLPLHLALLKGAASTTILRYLCRLSPAALQHADVQGNLPLHYAAEYAADPVGQLILQLYPAACRHANENDRFALHLLAARGWDYYAGSSQNKTTTTTTTTTTATPAAVVSLDLIQCTLQAHPEAVSQLDRYGRMPLHWASAQTQPRWEVLDLLIRSHSPALLVKDKAGQSPAALAKRMAPPRHKHDHDNDVVAVYLQERTAKERRKHRAIDKFFTRRVRDRKKNARFAKVSLLHCYG